MNYLFGNSYTFDWVLSQKIHKKQYKNVKINV